MSLIAGHRDPEDVNPMPRCNRNAAERAHERPSAEPAAEASSIADLLERMRNGDRDAAAEFITTYGSRVRRRVRGKLGSSMRRLFDSQEILSTVGRRLDQYVHDGKVMADAESQLWSLIFRIADHALIDKLRVFRRLEAIEGSDSRFAYTMLQRLRRADQIRPSGAELEIDRALRLLPDARDRQILSLWLEGNSHAHIADIVGGSVPAVRKRWQSIRERLREHLEMAEG